MSNVNVGTQNGFYTSNLWVQSIGSGDNAHFQNLLSTNNDPLGGIIPGREVDTYSSLSFNQAGVTYTYSGLFTVTVDRGLLSLTGSASASGYYDHIDVTAGTDTIASYDGVPIPVDFGSHSTGIIPDTVAGVLGLVDGLLFGASTQAEYNYNNLTLGATPNIPDIAFSDGVAINGNAGSDLLIGSSNSDAINGGGGNDIIIGGGGANVLNGGDGEDTVVFGFSLGDASLTYDANGHAIINGPNGTQNSLSGFEHYQFSDKVVNADSLDFAFPANREFFGEVGHDTNSHAGQVYALYEGLLGRAPDALGGAVWDDALDRGVSLHDVTRDFLGSDEARTHLNATDNAGYVEQLYEMVLGRHGEAQGAASWTAYLNGGGDRATLADQFIFSNEHVAQLQPAFQAGVFVADATNADVARLYYGLLDRAPDAGGLQGWVNQIDHGASLSSVANSFLSSDEYAKLHASPQTNEQYVDSLYLNALGRPAEPSGESFWANALSTHTLDKAGVALGIAESQEAHQHLVGQIEAGWHLA